VSLIFVFIISNSAFAYYPVVDLGTGAAYSVNDNGQIVGKVGPYAFLFDANGGGVNLGTLALGGQSAAYSINDKGQIVGYAYDGLGYKRPCLFDPTGNGNNTPLGPPFDIEPVGAAYSINNNGQIVGEHNFRIKMGTNWYTYSGAYLFDSNNTPWYHRLYPPPPYYTPGSAAAKSVNNNGQIVGYIGQTGFSHAYIFDPNGYGGVSGVSLGSLGGMYSAAESINNYGQIVGGADNSAGEPRACLFDPTGGGNNTDLGTISGYDKKSEACAINEKGQIVGEAFTSLFPPTSYHACLFDSTGGGNNTDLNTLIDPSSGWTLSCAYDINNNSWIVGYGTHNGQTCAFLLIIPEPASAIVLALGGTFLALRHKR
jgi:probable HAF family extracellular repeat protein